MHHAFLSTHDTREFFFEFWRLMRYYCDWIAPCLPWGE